MNKRANQTGAWMPNMIDQLAENDRRYKEWRGTNYDGTFEGLPPVARQFIAHLTGPHFAPPIYAHQKEAIVRTIFAYEILGFKDILLNIVTGGGKTLIIAALAAYMRQVHEIQTALLIAPNTIVRDRLKKDFDPAERDYVYRKFPFYFNSHADIAQRLTSVTLSATEGGRTSPEQIRGANVIIANIHQLYEGSPNLPVIEATAGNMVIFNDEAHNSVAEEWARVLDKFSSSGQQVLRVDTTATPERLDGNNPGSNKVYDYRVKHALHDRVIKQIVICQPEIVSVQYEVYEIDEETGEKKKVSVEEVPWEELESRRRRKEFSARQYITTENTVRPLAALAYDALRLQRKSAEGQGWMPILFVVAISIEDAKNIRTILEDKEFSKRYNEGRAYKVHLVTEQSEEKDRKIVMDLGNDPARPEVDVVVSVAMLREGWDVKNVGVILLLRRFTCRWVDGRPMSTFGPQTIGRGLRRIKPLAAISPEWERCLVVDHPVLDHQWLWDELGADVITKKFWQDDSITIEDLPEQPKPIDITPPTTAGPAAGGDLGTPIDIPPPSDSAVIEPMREWQKFLQEKQYENKGTNIKEKYGSIKKRTLDPKRGGMTDISEGDNPALDFSAPMQESTICPDAPTCHARIIGEIEHVAREAALEFGGSAKAYKTFFAIVENHVQTKFFAGKAIRSEIKLPRLEVVLRHYMPLVRDVFDDPTLLHGVWNDYAKK